MNKRNALKTISKIIGGTLGEGISAALKAAELNNARLFNNAQYGWVTSYLRSVGASQALIEKIAQKPEKGSYGILVDTRLGGALSIGLRDGDFMVGSLIDNPEYGDFKPSHRLASEVTRQYSVNGYDDIYAVTKGIEAFETTEAIGYDGIKTKDPVTGLGVEDFTATINTENPYRDSVYASYLEKQGEFYGLTQNQYTAPTLSRPNHQTPAQLKRSRHGQRPQIAKADLLADYQYPSHSLYAMEPNFTVGKNYAGPSQELSPQDVMSAAENSHLAALGRAHLNAKRAEAYQAGEFVSAEENRKTRDKALTTSPAPTTDVITAEDGHLIGFAGRHGLGWRDVWEVNKKNIPNPNVVQAGTALNVPGKRSASITPSPDANEFVDAYADQQRREQLQHRYRSGAVYKDYTSAKASAKRSSNRMMNTTGLNTDLLSSSINKALGNYNVGLGGWSPISRQRSNLGTHTTTTNGQGELEAVEARSRQLRDQEVRQHQAAAQAEVRQDQAYAARTKAADQETLGVLGPARAVSVANIDKLEENAITRSLNNMPALSPGVSEISLSQAPARRSTKQAPSRSRDRSRGSGVNTEGSNTSGASVTAESRGAARAANATTESKNGKVGGVGTLDHIGHLSHINGNRVNENQTNSARNKDGSYSVDANGNGAGNAGGTVICTELYRQGLLSYDVYRADQRFGMRLMRNDPYVILGYHVWAKSVVKLMRKSKAFTHFVHRSVGEAWAKEMALKEGLNGFGTIRGKLIIAIGVPACRVIGRILAKLNKPESNAAY